MCNSGCLFTFNAALYPGHFAPTVKMTLASAGRFYLTITQRARVFYEYADSQRGTAELTITHRQQGQVV